MLIIGNADVAKLLTMGAAIDALDQAYRQLVTTDAVCKPRTDIQIPTKASGKVYQWSSVEGGSTSGYFAIRMKSDIIYEQEYNGARTQEKYCIKPGTYCGLILLTDTESGEPLAILNDGLTQLTRVGADGGIGVKYLAKKNAEVIGMLGSGGMSQTHMEAFMHVRPGLKRLQVYSPTKANRERFGREMADKYRLEVKVCDSADEIYRDADIVAALTDSAVSVIDGSRIENGAHIVAPGTGGGIKDQTDPRPHRRLPAVRQRNDAVGRTARDRRRVLHLCRAPRHRHRVQAQDQGRPWQRRVIFAGADDHLRRHRRRQRQRPHVRRSDFLSRSAATCRATSSGRSRAVPTSSPRRRASAGKYRPSGSCRTSAIERRRPR